MLLRKRRFANLRQLWLGNVTVEIILMKMIFKRFKYLSIFLFIFLILFGYSDVKGDSCFPFLPEYVWLNEDVGYIFTGRVIKVNDKKYPVEYEVQITENFRGLTEKKIVKVIKGYPNYQRAENKEYLFIILKSENNSFNELICSYDGETIDVQEQAIEYFRLIKIRIIETLLLSVKSSGLLITTAIPKNLIKLIKFLLKAKMVKHMKLKSNRTDFTGLPT